MRFFEEIANRESRNENEIVLYPEGLFYKAYDRSAFACISRIPSFKPSKKRIKYCAREMASIGFPAAALPKYFPTAPRPLPDGRVVIALEGRIDTDACQVWKMSLPLKERRPRGSSKVRAYVPVLGRNGRTGDLFVHPVDLLPDSPAAFAAATTGVKQPVPATGGKGGVELSHLRQPQGPGFQAESGFASGAAGMLGGPAGRDGTMHPAMRECRAAEATACVRTEAEQQPVPATGERGAAMAVPESAKRPKWLLRLGYKILGINRLDSKSLPAEAESEALRGRLEAGAACAGPATPGAAVGRREMPAAGESGERSVEHGTQPRPDISGAVPAQAGTTLLRRDAAPVGKSADPRNETREQRVARLVREFRLEAATPVECLLFVADLKKEIDGYL